MTIPRALRGALLPALAAALALAGAAPPAHADEAETEARIQRLERLVEAQARELDRLRAEREAADAPSPNATRPATNATRPATAPASVATAGVTPPPTPTDPGGQAAFEATLQNATGALVGGGAASAAGGLRWGGYLTLEMISNSTKNTFFDLHRLILEFDAAIGERIDLTAEIEIEHGGADSILDGKIIVEQLQVRFHVCDAFVPKAGVLLIPFGRYNLNHDDPLNDFTLRPWTARYLIPTGFGQAGVGAEGSVPWGAGHVLSYDTALTTGFDDGFSTSGGVRGARQSWKSDNNENKQVWGRVASTFHQCFFDSVEIGVSGTYGRHDDDDDLSVWGWAIDGRIRKGPFEARGEYLSYHIDRRAGDPDTLPRRMSGAWAELAYHFFPPFLCGGCPPFVTDTSHFTLATRYQVTNLNHRIEGGAFQDDAESFGIALNYRITEDTVLRVDHTWIFAENEEDQRELTFSLSTFF